MEMVALNVYLVCDEKMFFILMLATVDCHDPLTLVGDSDVYLNIGMDFHSIDYDSADAEANSSLPGAVNYGFLQVNHDNLPLPCGHDVEEHAPAEWKDEFGIFINHQPNRKALKSAQ